MVLYVGALGFGRLRGGRRLVSVATCGSVVGWPAFACELDAFGRLWIAGKCACSSEANRFANCTCHCVLRTNHSADRDRCIASNDFVARFHHDGIISRRAHGDFESRVGSHPALRFVDESVAAADRITFVLSPSRVVAQSSHERGTRNLL